MFGRCLEGIRRVSVGYMEGDGMELEVRTDHVRTGQVGTDQVRTGQVSTSQVAASQLSTGQVGPFGTG